MEVVNGIVKWYVKRAFLCQVIDQRGNVVLTDRVNFNMGLTFQVFV